MNQHLPPSPTLFSHAEVLAGQLPAAMAASLLSAVGDVTFILSGDGTILDVAITQGDLANHGFSAWVGEAWTDTMAPESRGKAVEMLKQATAASPPRWRQVNHPAAGGDVPVRYMVMALGDSGRLIAIGRDMRSAAAMQQRLLQTQQSLERDYIRLRQAETRYRLLFDMASEPVLIVDGQSRQIREANPAAHRLLDVSDGALIGQPASSIVAADQRDDFVAFLGAAEASDNVDPAEMRLGDGQRTARITARMYRQSRQPLLIVRIDASAGEAGERRLETALGVVVERMPDAFVLADRELKVLTANAAFAEMVEMPSSDRIVGAALGSWLGRPGIDLDLIVGQLRDHGSVRNVGTVVRGAAGAQEEVEVSGVSAMFEGRECYGFAIRGVARRLRDATPNSRDMPRSVEQLTELVGRISLKEIVRESTDMIERLCIEAALAYTSDNRASAAEVLGLSRQSLYSKLHRHGLGNFDTDVN